LLNEAVDIVNIFVDHGQEVVTTKGKLPDKNHTYKTTNPAVDMNIPLAIVVDGQSASASEILSAPSRTLTGFDHRPPYIWERPGSECSSPKL